MIFGGYVRHFWFAVELQSLVGPTEITLKAGVTSLALCGIGVLVSVCPKKVCGYHLQSLDSPGHLYHDSAKLIHAFKHK